MSACKACSNDREPKGLTEIGRPVTCRVAVGRGHDLSSKLNLSLQNPYRVGHSAPELTTLLTVPPK